MPDQELPSRSACHVVQLPVCLGGQDAAGSAARSRCFAVHRAAAAPQQHSAARHRLEARKALLSIWAGGSHRSRALPSLYQTLFGDTGQVYCWHCLPREARKCSHPLWKIRAGSLNPHNHWSFPPLLSLGSLGINHLCLKTYTRAFKLTVAPNT